MGNQLGPLGPCTIWFGDVNLGMSFGDVLAKDEVQGEDIFYDQMGVTPVDKILLGRLVSVEIPLTDTSLAVLEDVIAGSVKASDTLKVSNVVGRSAFNASKQLKLIRIVDDIESTDPDHVFIFNRAYPLAKLEVPFGVGTQRVYTVEFIAFPDDESTRVGEIYRIGS